MQPYLDRARDSIGQPVSTAEPWHVWLAHPDLVKVWGRERPLPQGDLRRYYELAIDGIAESGIAVEYRCHIAGAVRERERVRVQKHHLVLEPDRVARGGVEGSAQFLGRGRRPPG